MFSDLIPEKILFITSKLTVTCGWMLVRASAESRNLWLDVVPDSVSVLVAGDSVEPMN